MSLSQRLARIFVAESQGFSSTAATLLREVGELVLADVDRKGLLISVRDADVLWVRLRHQIDSEVIAAAERLKIIATPTTGLNHVDLQETGRLGIQVLSLKGEKEFLQDVRATAEHTVGLILALLRHIPAALRHVRDGGWNRDLFKGHELCGKIVGIIGYGRLGRIVARYLSALDARILVTDPNLNSGATEPNVTPVSLHELLRQADLVTLHVNLSEGTRGFFGQREFSLMKEGAWFVNTARGELLDEDALLKALESRWLSGAALDVLCDERSDGMGDHPLIAYARIHDNLLITPHIGGCTAESMEKTELFLANRLVALLKATEVS
jgi:D-3-phosphoglycerate dehydrogenase / 2-oxoglutarate reductase